MAWSRSKSLAVLIVSFATACCLLTSAGESHAQVWGVWSDPTPVAQGSWKASGHFLAGDLVGLMGQVRGGINERADFGVQVGMPDFDFDFAFAGDLRYLIMPTSDTFPMDLTACGAFGWMTMGNSAGGYSADVTLLDIAFGVIASKSIDTQGGLTFVPYGSFMIDIGKFSVDTPSGLTPIQQQAWDQSGAGDNTETDINFRGGVDFPVNDQLSVNGELNFSTRDNYIYLTFGAGFAL